MNVLHVTPGFHPAHIYGGPIESVYQLCRHLGLAGCTVQVLTTDANGPHAVLEVDTRSPMPIEKNVTVRYCPRIFPHTVSTALLRHLPSYIRQADVVHLTSVYSFPTIPTLALCNLLGKPVVWSPRGSFQRWEGSRRIIAKSWWDAICKSVAPSRLVLHTTSDQEARETGCRMAGIELAIIPNGVVVPEALSHETGSGLLRLLYIGRLHPIKGIENLLRACRILNDRHGRGWALTIAGAGDAAYVNGLRELMAGLALGDQVTFLGEVAGEAKQKLFPAADVLVLPSFSENYGLVVAEALAHGVPVIAGSGTPWAELEKRMCGLWVDNSPESLAGAISRIGTMPLQEMGASGRAWMKAESGWDRIAENMFDLYKTLAGCS